MALLDTLFGGGQQKAYEDINKSYQQAISAQQAALGRATGYMQPFYGAGVSGLGAYQQGLSAMADPQKFYQQMMSGYSMSPQAQFQQQQAIQAANQAAAASGMLGSGAEQKALANYTQQLTARDQQQWLNNMLGIYRGYLGGEQGLGQMGYGAAGQMGQWQTQSGRDIADLMARQGQAQAGIDLSRAGALQNLLGLGGSFLTGGLVGGGYMPKTGFWGGGLSALFPQSR